MNTTTAMKYSHRSANQILTWSMGLLVLQSYEHETKVVNPGTAHIPVPKTGSSFKIAIMYLSLFYCEYNVFPVLRINKLNLEKNDYLYAKNTTLPPLNTGLTQIKIQNFLRILVNMHGKNDYYSRARTRQGLGRHSKSHSVRILCYKLSYPDISVILPF